jgi:tetratricopeptide (TPR) repeat protein
MCGGDLNLIEGASTAECEFCGSVQTIPKVDDEKKLTLFARANRLRIACEFDKAAGIYEAIVADFPEEAEAYWGLVLCKYGIEYVDDPATGKKIPTCHRSSFDSIMEDSDFEQALENADGAARKVYREEAKQIEEIRKGIISVSSNEQPYDIFICYKETDANGDRTLDSVLAQDVYDALTGNGYRVFFSRITLEDKLGTEYEPYIFAALNSAKIMLAFGTDYEYFNAVWVKNEWSRFLKLMAKDKEKHLIPCFKGIDAYDMPKEFARLQAQDLGKVGAIQDLLRGIEKIMPHNTEPQQQVVQQSASNNNPTIESYIKRAFMFLEDGDWRSANEYCEKVLDIDPENAMAYVGKLMADLKVERQEELGRLRNTFDDNKYYRKALHFADDSLKAKLTGYIEQIGDLQEYIRKSHIYDKACAKMTNTTIRGLEEAISLFGSISGWKDADEQILKCKKLLGEEPISGDTNQRLLSLRKRLQPAQPLISTRHNHTAAICSNGTVMVAGDRRRGEDNVHHWNNIVAVSVGLQHTVGLKSDGTVIVTGDNGDGQCNTADWRDVVAISAGSSHTVGLQADGTVVATGENKHGQCNVSGWTDIVSIAADNEQTLGLKSDGTVVTTAFEGALWKGIVAISRCAGLKADGTVVTTLSAIQSEVAGWRDIVAIAAYKHVVGLKADGTVVAAAYNTRAGWCDVGDWTNMIAIDAGEFHTIGLRADGKVMITKYLGSLAYTDVYDKVSQWRTFQNFDNLEQEKIEARRELQQHIWRLRKQCQHCGGELKGFFGKKCVSCGIPKDY